MKKELKEIGLTTYQSRALEVLLKEKLTLKELSRKANIPPGKVYSVAKQLINLGLIKSTNDRPQVLYVENASDTVSKLVQKYEAKQNNIIKNLQELASSLDNQQGRETPFFDLGVSIEDNQRIQLRTFVEAEKEILQIINVHHKPKANRRSKTLWEKEIEKAIERGVILKAIYPEKIILPKILDRLSKKSDKFCVKRLDTNFVRCDIIDRKKVLIKLMHEDPITFGGLVFIENRRFAENLRNVFNKFWDEAE